MEFFEKELQKCCFDVVKLIVVDGVFSMEGDIVNLFEIVCLFKKYDVNIMVDEVYGLGVLGNYGCGICDYFGLIKEVDFIMGIFSKLLVVIGGFIVVDEFIINYLCYNLCLYIFSVSNMFVVIVVVCVVFQIMKNELECIEYLWDIINYFLKCFCEFGFEIGYIFIFIIFLYVCDMEKIFMVIKMLFDEGVFVNLVVFFVCFLNDMLICFLLMVIYFKEQIDFVIGKLVKCFKVFDFL